ncbi:MAG: argininosuccinate lyase [Clostridia bacterium]|nr:argininosuccinate lyase [Clostridia bacterium]
MAKLWDGRFEKETNPAVNDFNSSLRFDKRMFRQDIRGSIAHAAMLGKQGIIPMDTSIRIQEGLQGILADMEAGRIDTNTDAEDIHMFVESLLTERIGDDGKRLHTGRSRNDQVALDLRLYVLDESNVLKEELVRLMRTLLAIAKENLTTWLPGYTHLQKAQPVTLAHHMMAYFAMFRRDLQRLTDWEKRTAISPLGSGAMAGTTYPLDREFVADQLGLLGITDNSLDGVSDRDFAIELGSCISLIMMHLSRFSEELILWSTNEFSFVEMDDAYSTGSSIMPQKKNPDVTELIRGKTGRVYGNLMTLLTMMKGLPLAYNKDMQEDKEAIFDSLDTVFACLPVFTDMLATMKIKKENMAEGAKGGYMNATDLADYLVYRGLPFRDAHAVSGKLVLYAIHQNKALDDLSLEEMRAVSPMFDETIYEAISLSAVVNRRNLPGGPAPEAVTRAIENAESYLNTL